MSECCLNGTRHEGTPKGNEIKLGELDWYVSGEEQGKSAVLLLTDVFGHAFINSRLVADDFNAGLNVPVYVPDYLGGYPMATDLIYMRDEKRDSVFSKIWYGLRFGAKIPAFLIWWNAHRMDVTLPRVKQALVTLKTKGYEKVVVQGYCFGGMTAILTSPHLDIEAFVSTHPAGVSMADIEAIKHKCLLQMPDTDIQWSKEMYKSTEDALVAKGSRFHRYEKVEHGFAVRCSPDDKVAMEAKAAANKEACEFFKQFL